MTCETDTGTCDNYEVANNVISGGYLGGLFTYATECSDSDTTKMVYDNEISSIMGAGAVIFADDSLTDC